MRQIHQTTEQTGLATAAQAQRFLSLSRTTLWRLERAGELQGVRIGRALRFRWADLQRLAQGVEQDPPSLSPVDLRMIATVPPRAAAAWAIARQHDALRDAAAVRMLAAAPRCSKSADAPGFRATIAQMNDKAPGRNQPFEIIREQ